MKCAHLLVMMMNLKMKVTCLGLEHPLSLFKYLSLENYSCWRGYPYPLLCENPFIWWHKYKGQFLDVTFLAKQILGILRSQIEIKKVFNLVGVLTTLGWKHVTVVKDCRHKYYFLKLCVFWTSTKLILKGFFANGTWNKVVQSPKN